MALFEKPYFKILVSISSKLRPFVSGTYITTNASDIRAITAKSMKRFSAPRSSCITEMARLLNL